METAFIKYVYHIFNNKTLRNVSFGQQFKGYLLTLALHEGSPMSQEKSTGTVYVVTEKTSTAVR